jgi:hypothetical protein
MAPYVKRDTGEITCSQRQLARIASVTLYQWVSEEMEKWRQQPRHYPVLVRLSVSSHFLLSAPPGFRSYLSGNLSDTGYPSGESRLVPTGPTP